MRVVLVAEESAGVQALQRIVASGHEVVRVLSSAVARSEVGSTVARAAADRGIPVSDARRVTEPTFADELRQLGVEVLLNVHSLNVIDPDVLAAPTIGSFNLHPGPLPEYAGLNTVSWAIYEGAAEYGVTLHWLAAQVDAGAIAYQARFPLEEDATALRLMSRCVREGMVLLGRLLAQLSSGPGDLPRDAQDLARRRFFQARSVPQGGEIEWARSALEIVRFVRACDYGPFASPWGYPRALLEGDHIEVLGATRTGLRTASPPGTVDRASGTVRVAAGDEWVSVSRIRAAGTAVRGSRETAGR